MHISTCCAHQWLYAILCVKFLSCSYSPQVATVRGKSDIVSSVNFQRLFCKQIQCSFTARTKNFLKIEYIDLPEKIISYSVCVLVWYRKLDENRPLSVQYNRFSTRFLPLIMNDYCSWLFHNITIPTRSFLPPIPLVLKCTVFSDTRCM